MSPPSRPTRCDNFSTTASRYSKPAGPIFPETPKGIGTFSPPRFGPLLKLRETPTERWFVRIWPKPVGTSPEPMPFSMWITSSSHGPVRSEPTPPGPTPSPMTRILERTWIEQTRAGFQESGMKGISSTFSERRSSWMRRVSGFSMFQRKSSISVSRRAKARRRD